MNKFARLLVVGSRKDELVVDERVYGLAEVLEVEHLVNEGEGEGLIPKVVVNSLLVLACNPHGIFGLPVIALPTVSTLGI
jgi:hypothetical protein